jgi:drug/metabolite transporter (DMT)-like permease
VPIAVAAAMAAAFLFAVATAMQHLSTDLVQDAGNARRAGVKSFASRTVRNPLWVRGLLAAVAGLALHALALREGPLTVVQPLLVTGVLFALPLRQILEHRRPSRSEVAWAATLAAGLALFLVVATPADGTARAPDEVPTIVAAALIGAGIIGASVAAWYTSGGRAALMFGGAAALAFAAGAGLLKQVMNTLGHGLGAEATSWPLYALIGVGLLGFVLSQLAYQAGPLRLSLPVVTTVDPIVSLIIGVSVFDEPFRKGTGAIVAETLGLVLVVVATVALTHDNAAGPSSPGWRRGKPLRTVELRPAPKGAVATHAGRTWRSVLSGGPH